MDENELLAVTAMLLLSATAIVLKRKQRRQRRYKTRPIYQRRDQKGFFVSTFLPMKKQDAEQFFKYTRMTVPLFDHLLELVTPHIVRKRLPNSISPEQKFEITLQYLSQGVSMQSLAWSHHMGIATVHRIVNELCPIIWEVLSPQYLKTPSKEEMLEISNDFFNLWNFPNCIGALDGKHISITAPPHSGSLFFNYKKSFSIVLLACCDARYIFRLVDIGAYGSSSDGGIFKNSVFGQLLDSGKLNVPEDTFLSNTYIKAPYVLVADEAFPLKSYIMRPYPGRQLSIVKRIFNYRLSRARRTIENTLSIMVARWQILKKPIVADVANVDNFVKAVVCLHNYCQINMSTKYCPKGFADEGDDSNGNWRKEAENLKSVGRLSSNRSTKDIYELRNNIANYFISEASSVPWQHERVEMDR